MSLLMKNQFLNIVKDVYQDSDLPIWLKDLLISYTLGRWCHDIVEACSEVFDHKLSVESAQRVLTLSQDKSQAQVQQAFVVVSAALLVDPTSSELQALLKHSYSESEYRSLCELLSAISGYRMWLITFEDASLISLPQIYESHPSTYQQRIEAIRSMTEALLKASTTQEVIDATLEQGFSVCGAHAGVIAEVDVQMQQLNVISTRGYEQAMVEQFKHIPLAAPYPLTRAYQERQHVFIDSLETEDDFRRIVEAHEPNTPRNHNSWAVLLLQINQKIFGVLGLSFTNIQRFTPGDRMYMETLAHQCALAYERTAYFEAEQKARKQAQLAQEHLRFLADASNLFYGSLQVADIKQMLGSVVVRYFADWCGIYMLTNETTFDQLLVYYNHAPVMVYKQSIAIEDLNPSVGMGRIIHTLQPEWYPHIDPLFRERLERDEPLFQELIDRTVYSYMTIPLVVRGAIRGIVALALLTDERPYSVVDLELATQLVNNAATAIDNAQLYAKVSSSEQSYRDALNVLDALLEYAPVGMAFWNRERRFVRVNTAMAKINQLAISDHIGRTVKEIWPTVQVPFSDALDKVYATGLPLIDHEISTRGLVPRAQERSWLVNFYPVVNEDDAVIGTGGIISDITERKCTEEKWRFLAALSKALTASLESTHMLEQVTHLLVPELADWCAVLLLDEEQERLEPVATAPSQSPWIERYLWVHEHLNRHITEELKYNTASLLDHSQPELRTLLEQVGFDSVLVTVLHTRDNHLGLLVLANMSPDRSFLPTDVQIAEETAQRLSLALDNANLYAAAQQALLIRDQFVSVAAHELKTPMTTMIGYTQLLMRRVRSQQTLDTDRGRRAIESIYEQTDRLHRLVLSMLDLTRIQLGHLSIDLQPLDLVQLVQRVAVEIEPTLDHHRVLLEVTSEPVMINGDELRMEQVVHNLVSNGIKYSIEGGDVVIRLVESSNVVHLSVQDYGVGIPSADVQNLFTRFYRASNTEMSVSGMGLGLYIVREIIEQHGGTVRVESIEDQGSTFTISLPRSLG